MEKNIEIIADTYGEHSQLVKAQEECGELFQAIQDYFEVTAFDPTAKAWDKDKKYKAVEAWEHVMEEMADVKIMLEQIEYFNRKEHAESDWYGWKISRQIARLKREEK